MPRSFAFHELDSADLVVDAEYEGGTSNNVSDDPLDRLLGCGNQGGFRVVGSLRQPAGFKLAVIYSSGVDPDWPDQLVPETGVYSYYGDNKQPGHGLHDTQRGGNEFLRTTFDYLHVVPARRDLIPPLFIFTRGKRGRNVVFRGLAAPGAPGVSAGDDLVAIWRTRGSERFQNYRATFTVLDATSVTRGWIDALLAGGRPLADSPAAWRTFVERGSYRPLVAPRVREYRTEEEQMPKGEAANEIVRAVWTHFSEDFFAFEAFAARLWLMHAGAVEYELTRPVVDGGRDAIGKLFIGPTSDPIGLDFALEAKCYNPEAKTVGVRETARLISRLRHRQFGVLVTTSVLARQAYQELRSDAHPVVVISGGDIARILTDHGYSDAASVSEWLRREFPIGNPIVIDPASS